MRAARLGAAWASISTSRVSISAARSGAAPQSRSASSIARSRSAASTVVERRRRPLGASCARKPMRRPRGSSIVPASGCKAPRIRSSKVDLPAPLRPTSPTLTPSAICALGLGRARSARRCGRSGPERVSMPNSYHGGRDQRRACCILARAWASFAAVTSRSGRPRDDHTPARRDRHAARRGRHPGPDHRPRRLRAQSAPPADHIAGSQVRLRPHAKTHKCPVIALKQMALGAVGVCVQKVSEAEAMVYGGVTDVLVTNEIVGRQKLRRLMALAASARIGVCADDPARSRRSTTAAGEAGVTLPGLCRDQHGRQPLRRRAGRAGARLGAPHRRRAASDVWRAAGLSRLGAASARLGRAPRRRSPRPTAKAGRTRDLLGAERHRLPEHHRRRHRHLRVRDGERRLHRTAMRLLHLHGRRLRPQPRPRRRPDQGLRAEPLRLGDGDEPPDRRARDRRCRPEGARLRFRPAAPSGTSPPPPTSAPPTSTAASPSPPPPTGCASATRSASSPATATRPSTSTTGMSASAATASRRSGRSPPGGRCTESV